MIGICEYCGKEFIKKVSNQKYCSGICSRNSLKKRNREKYKKQAKKIIVQCKYCGADFLKDEKRRVYCCDFCRESAKLEREELRKERYRRLESSQPCWTCKNYIDGCNWSRRLLPVPGWIAEKVLRQEDGEEEYGYRIEYCPEYEYDGS